MFACRLLKPTLLLVVISAGACDCSASHAPEDAAADIGSDSALTDSSLPLDAAPDVHLMCGWEPTPECATDSNATVSLTRADGSVLELAFGYLSYNRGFDFSMSLLFMDNGNADRCSPIQLHGRIMPGISSRIVSAGVHEVNWVLADGPSVSSHGFVTTVRLSAANDVEFSGPVAGSIVDFEADERILGFSGAFEMDECEAWATSGS